MIVRPFGYLGARYKVNAQGKRYYLSSWVVSFVAIALIALSGHYEEGHPGSVPWLLIGLVVFLLLGAVIRLLALTIENGEAVKKR